MIKTIRADFAETRKLVSHATIAGIKRRWFESNTSLANRILDVYRGIGE